MTINDELTEFLKKEPEFQTSRELANIILKHFNQTGREDRIEQILECANLKWFNCPEHGKRVGYFYICDICSGKISGREKCQPTKVSKSPFGYVLMISDGIEDRIADEIYMTKEEAEDDIPNIYTDDIEDDTDVSVNICKISIIKQVDVKQDGEKIEIKRKRG